MPQGRVRDKGIVLRGAWASFQAFSVGCARPGGGAAKSSAVRPDLPGEIALGVGDGLPALDEDVIACDGLDSLAQSLLGLAERSTWRNADVCGLNGDDDPAAAGNDLKRVGVIGERGWLGAEI